MDTVIYEEEYPEGDWVKVKVSNNGMKVWVLCHDVMDDSYGVAIYNREEAIAAARAILAHFKECE